LKISSLDGTAVHLINPSVRWRFFPQ
jgi:hypothetical protein